MKSRNVRALAASIVSELLANRGSLSTHLAKFSDYADSALLQQLCYGCCRYYFELHALLAQLLETPLRNKDQDLHCLLMLGIYQLRYMRTPAHAAVNETVAAAVALQKSWARGLINAVLRNYLKRLDELDTFLLQQDIATRTAHPEWLANALAQDWPAQSEQLLRSNNQHPPMTLRVNLGKISRDNYLALLEESDLPARPGTLSDSAVYLEAPCQVAALPGFNQGLVSVQDEASQLVVVELVLGAGLALLDACAAPGGKACHILECKHLLTKLIALDNSERRLTQIADNLARLDLRATVLQGDAACPASWWDGELFDRILLDAPCSATGVIRRHPDIKLLRRKDEIDTLAAQQLNLLTALWTCLKPGGVLLYTTCSLLRQENEGVIAQFLQQETGAENSTITADWGVECRFGRQLLPADKGSDGFYFARLIKKSAGQG
jgi:16S rRNA (cytosine967-C5)-methyltransferase